MAERNENFPNGGEASLLVVMLFIAEYLVNAAAYDSRRFLSMDPQDIGGIVMVLGNGLIFTFLMHYKSLSYRELFHSSSSSKTATVLVLFPAIALTIPVLVLAISSLLDFLVWLVPLSDWEVAMFARMGSGSFSNVVYACVLAPVLEEMLFRGIILRSFLRQYAKWTAIVGSATLFGFAHMNIYQFVGALIMGVFLGWLYERTRSLLPCIALHATFNSTVTAMDLTVANDAQGIASGISPLSWAAAFLLGATGVFILRRALIVPTGRMKNQ